MLRKKKEKKAREKNGQKNTEKDTEMPLDTNRNIDWKDEKVSVYCQTHIAVGHRIQRGSPGPLGANTPLGVGDWLSCELDRQNDIVYWLTRMNWKDRMALVIEQIISILDQWKGTVK